MRRYARKIGSVGVGLLDVPAFIVITTEDHDRAIAEGFEPIPDDITDEAVKRTFGVDVFYSVADKSPVN